MVFEGLTPLLLNTVIVLVPVFTYHMMSDRVTNWSLNRQRLVQWLSLSLTVVVCMCFPFAIAKGYYFDLRAVPVLIGMLCCGGWVGSGAAAVALAFRLFEGPGHGFVAAVASLLPVLLFAAYFTPRYRRLPRTPKLAFATTAAFVQPLIVAFFTFIMDGDIRSKALFFLLFCVVSGVTMWLAVYLTEHTEESRRMRHELMHTEKMQVVSELAASIAHEVRNPITTVRGFTQLISRDKYIQSKYLDYLRLMTAEIDRAQQIITDYLSFARPSDQTVEEIDVQSRVLHVVTLLTPYATERAVRLSTQIDAACRIRGNATEFQQALINLIKNAIDAIPSNATKGEVRVHLATAKGDVELSVTDNGVGLSPSEIRRLGTPFYSTKVDGTGLGLMVTYQIIKRMNGRVEVTSEKHKGTTFLLVLPAAGHDRTA